MTSIEWLQNELKKSIHFYRLIEDLESKSTVLEDDVFQQAKEMHKAEIIDAFKKGQALGFDDNPNYMAEQYYKETFGSKGSDDHVPKVRGMVENDVEKLAEIEYPIFDGDLLGIVHNQEHRRFGFISGYNKAKETPTSSQTTSDKWKEYQDWLNETLEISDEEIEKFADEELGTIRTDFDFGVIQGMKWYREQLKQNK